MKYNTSIFSYKNHTHFIEYIDEALKGRKSERQRVKKISKFISLALRHKPLDFGLELDRFGYCDVDLLCLAIAIQFNLKSFSRTELLDVLDKNDKQRCTFSDNGNLIRSAQGHSFPVDLKLVLAENIPKLFHGTTRSVWKKAIQYQGLSPMSRQHVHLTDADDEAFYLATRKGKPIVLLIDTKQMQYDGIPIYQSENQVYLTSEIPPKYLSIWDY